MASDASKHTHKKPKLVRDSFTIPKAEFAAIDTLKTRAIAMGTSVKKSELLRAGLMLLTSLSDSGFKTAIAAVPTLKTGRPAAHEITEVAKGTAAGAKPVAQSSRKNTATAPSAVKASDAKATTSKAAPPKPSSKRASKPSGQSAAKPSAKPTVKSASAKPASKAALKPVVKKAPAKAATAKKPATKVAPAASTPPAAPSTAAKSGA